MARDPMDERLPAAPAEFEPPPGDLTAEAPAAASTGPRDIPAGAGPPGRTGRSPLREAWTATPRWLRAALVVCLLPLTAYVFALRLGLGAPHPPTAGAPPAAAGPAQAALPRPSEAAPVVAPAAPATPAPLPAATPVTAAAASASQAPTPRPASTPSGPSRPPTPAPTAVPQPPGQVASCGAPANPWGYTFCGGNLIRATPRDFCSIFPCVAHFWDQSKADYVAECYDGSYAQDTHGNGSCLPHGGEMRPLYRPPGSPGLLALSDPPGA
jgi:hypothetical protein